MMTLTFAKTNLRFPLAMNRRGKIRNRKLPGQLNRTRVLESHRMPGLSQFPSCRAKLICMLAADSILESMENEAQFEKTGLSRAEKSVAVEMNQMIRHFSHPDFRFTSYLFQVFAKFVEVGEGAEIDAA